MAQRSQDSAARIPAVGEQEHNCAGREGLMPAAGACSSQAGAIILGVLDAFYICVSAQADDTTECRGQGQMEAPGQSGSGAWELPTIPGKREIRFPPLGGLHMHHLV